MPVCAVSDTGGLDAAQWAFGAKMTLIRRHFYVMCPLGGVCLLSVLDEADFSSGMHV